MHTQVSWCGLIEVTLTKQKKMKPKLHHYGLSLLVAALGLAGVAGCASTGSSGTKSLLSAAGFHTHAPATPKQKELYTAMPAYKVERVTFKGKTFYAYKDEKDGIAYLGDESNYQRYEALAIERKIAQDQYQAAEMQRDMATGWYGAYGPYVGGMYHYGGMHRYGR